MSGILANLRKSTEKYNYEMTVITTKKNESPTQNIRSGIKLHNVQSKHHSEINRNLMLKYHHQCENNDYS